MYLTFWPINYSLKPLRNETFGNKKNKSYLFSKTFGNFVKNKTFGM
jgi:hypothetical protein